MKIYDFKVKDLDGNDVSLDSYKGKVVLVVNTATKCGFTPQYKELQDFYEKYNAQGFEIIDFPCNQFKDQAPEDNQEIHKFCTGRFGITFPQYGKIDVNGENEDPLYTYLKQEKPVPNFGKGLKAKAFKKIAKALNGSNKESDIQWNFAKFLIDREGNVIERYEPTVSAKVIEAKLVELLK